MDAAFIQGVGKSEKHVVFLLDIDRVLTTAERVEVSQSENRINPLGGGGRK